MTAITTSELTTKALNGTGVFDEIMSTLQLRLDEQWSENRIKGTEYAKVYLESLNSAMQQSIAFLLGKDIAAANADLIIAQKDKVLEEINQTIAQTNLLVREMDKLNSEIALLDQNLINTQVQKLLLDQELIKSVSETALIDQNLANAIVQENNLVLEGLHTSADTDRIIKDYLKTDAEILGIKQNTYNAVVTATNLLRQQEKMEAETQLLAQKKYTEQAQIIDIVNGLNVDGVIGKQKGLYQAQTDGFSRDAEQKLAKIMADSWSIRRSTDEGENPAGTGLTNVDIQRVISKATAGIKA